MYQYYNQYKLIHRGTVHNKLLKNMNIVDSDICLYCNEHIETIEHIYLQCSNVKRLWKDTTSWVRNIYDQHFMISDHKKIFGCSKNNQITHLLITSVKDVIYKKR